MFICGGAFPDLENIIKERLNKQASIGFYADLKDKYDNDPHILEKVTVDDIRDIWYDSGIYRTSSDYIYTGRTE